MGGQMAINRMNQRTEAKHLHAICVQAEKSQVSFEVWSRSAMHIFHSLLIIPCTYAP